MALCGQASPADTWTTYTLDLDGGAADLFWQRNVIIPERPLVELLCGPTVIAGQHLVGESTHGDRYSDYTLDLDADQATLLLDEVLLLIDSLVLELDGGPVIVNPALMPLICAALDLVALACTPLDLTPLVVEEVDLDPLVCLEA